ncbi:unnamed protein product [Closterium sp. Naga37s-1]|nr:unnamed protein product [Closterium sp. Naga37s-1]
MPDSIRTPHSTRLALSLPQPLLCLSPTSLLVPPLPPSSPRPHASPSLLPPTLPSPLHPLPIFCFRSQPRSGTRYSATRYSDSDGRYSMDGDSGKGFTGNGSADGQGFELPNSPSRFDASVAWRHTLYRTADSCWSQQERHLYHTANPSLPSAVFRAAVEEFEAMQRECVGFRGVDSWQWVKDRATWNKTIPRYGRDRKRCRYIAIRDLDRGLGNRITSYVVSFILGLLTNRAIIAPPPAFLTHRFCNPFAHANTSWTVELFTQRLLWSTVLHQPKLNVSALAREMNSLRHGVLEDLRSSVQEDGTVFLDLKHRVQAEFCDQLWDVMGEATFWYTSTDAYFIPSLYYIPSFAARLNQLFPDGRVFTHVARYLLHPDNQLWDEITAAFHTNLAPFSHRLGIQIRSLHASDLPVAHRVLDCAINISHYLPPTAPLAPNASWAEAHELPYEKVGVFVSSLNMRHLVDMQHHYQHRHVLASTRVDFWTLTNEEAGNHEEGQMESAVLDMWLLSFCDRLLITHLCTFGSTAAGLGGMDWQNAALAVRHLTVTPLAFPPRMCPHLPPSDRLLITDLSTFGSTAAGLAGMNSFSMAVTVQRSMGIDWRNSSSPTCQPVSSEPSCQGLSMSEPHLKSGTPHQAVPHGCRYPMLYFPHPFYWSPHFKFSCLTTYLASFHDELCLCQ